MTTNRLITFSILFFFLPGISATANEELNFDQINREKTNYALELTVPIYRCLVNGDTDHPVFNGCVDWHSSVHATWALIAFTRASGDNRYVSTITETLNPSGLDKERQFLRENVKFEMPYGRAWFLRLSIEHGKLFGNDLLIEFSDEVADSMIRFYKRKPPNPLTKSYKNPTWALLSLLDYGHYRARPDIIDFVRDQVTKYYLKESPSCQFNDSRPNFMSICTNWAWLVGSVVGKEEFLPWVYSFMPPDKLVSPLVEPEKPHEYGLNFSRSWGLLRLYRLTGNVGYRDAFTGAFLQSYLNRSHWDGDYRKVGHWVAQFGIFALMPLFEEPALE